MHFYYLGIWQTLAMIDLTGSAYYDGRQTMLWALIARLRRHLLSERLHLVRSVNYKCLAKLGITSSEYVFREEMSKYEMIKQWLACPFRPEFPTFKASVHSKPYGNSEKRYHRFYKILTKDFLHPCRLIPPHNSFPYPFARRQAPSWFQLQLPGCEVIHNLINYSCDDIIT